ncbi:hypothetical protein FS837_000851 [Tulasnella sp. UAMH 9824]|nr:hypothetical protein FS837_000851 [Tulasnella sp. UAMH 9824]
MASNEGRWWLFLHPRWDGSDSEGSETQDTNIIFRGTDGDECEAFVVAIRDLAFAKGKEKDYHWMLHYATTRLRGKALRWHAELDASIRRDWDLLVQAMFKEYPFIEKQEQGGIATPVW